MTWKPLPHRPKSRFSAGASCCSSSRSSSQATAAQRPRRRPICSARATRSARIEKLVAGRLDRALKNLLETYPAFIAIVLALVVTGKTGGLAATGAWLWLAARVVYVLLYAAGIPVRQDARLAGVDHRPGADADPTDDLNMKIMRASTRSEIALFAASARRPHRPGIRRLPHRTRDLCRHERRRRTRIHAGNWAERRSPTASGCCSTTASCSTASCSGSTRRAPLRHADVQMPRTAT